MFAEQRKEHILDRVRQQGAVRVADLVAELDVSDMTIRRDIAELAKAGLVQRVHGGAVAPGTGSGSVDEPTFSEKQARDTAEKQAIAQRALADIRPGQAIALSGGTTTHLLARLIAADAALRPLTVVTNSLPAADALHAGGDDLETILVGGVRTPSDALVGPVAEATLATLRVDRLYLGVHGLSTSGLTAPNLDEAATDRALVACATGLTVLADHTKWGSIGLARIAPLDRVDLLISDEGLPPEVRRHLSGAVRRLALVEA